MSGRLKAIITAFFDKIVEALSNHVGPPFLCHVRDRLGRSTDSDWKTICRHAMLPIDLCNAPPEFSGSTESEGVGSDTKITDLDRSAAFLSARRRRRRPLISIQIQISNFHRARVKEILRGRHLFLSCCKTFCWREREGGRGAGKKGRNAKIDLAATFLSIWRFLYQLIRTRIAHRLIRFTSATRSEDIFIRNQDCTKFCLKPPSTIMFPIINRSRSRSSQYNDFPR